MVVLITSFFIFVPSAPFSYVQSHFINPQRACAERVTVVTLSVCLSVSLSLFYSGEGADFRVETYISIHSR